MLANKHLNQEIKAVEETIKKLKEQGKEFEAASLKIGTLQLKLLQNLRANDVAIMKHAGIALQESEPSDAPKV